MKLRLAIFTRLPARRLPPSRYPDAVLKYLVRAYDDPSDDRARTRGLTEVELWRKSGIMRDPAKDATAPLYRAFDLLRQRGHIQHVNYFNGSPTYQPTAEGFAYGRGPLAPWYVKALRAVGVGSLVRGIVVAIAAPVILAVIATWGGGLWP
jgi:hypothetical protein